MQQFKQAYIDIPYSERDIELAKSHFQREYNVFDEDIIEVRDGSMSNTNKKWMDLYKRLKEYGKQGLKVLCIHVFAGHGT